MKTRPDEAWEALLKEVLKGDSKRIWHGELWVNLTLEQRELILPMMKNYIEKYLPSGEFEKSKVRVLVRGDLQELVGETQGPLTRTESIFILISIAIHRDLEIFKIDITAAYLNAPMNEDVKHKWLMLDKDVASVLLVEWMRNPRRHRLSFSSSHHLTYDYASGPILSTYAPENPAWTRRSQIQVTR